MAWGFQQSTSGTSGSSPDGVAYGTNNVAGNFLVCGVEVNSAATVISVSDTANGAWTSAISPQKDGSNHNIQIFYFSNCKVGANTVSAAATGTVAYMNLVIAEYSGILLSSPEDGIGAGTIGNGISPASGTFTAAAGDLIIGVGVGGAIVVGAGFLSRGTDSFSMLEESLSAGGLVNATFGNSSSNWAALGVAFSTTYGGWPSPTAGPSYAI